MSKYRVVNLVEMALFILKTYAVTVPLLAFWIGVGLIAFYDTTLVQIVDKPQNLYHLALTMATFVTAYRTIKMVKGSRQITVAACSYQGKGQKLYG